MTCRLLYAALLCAGLALPGVASAIGCPGGGPRVDITAAPGLAGGVRPEWPSSGPRVRVDPRAGGYQPALFAQQIYQFLLMHGLAHVCLGHVTPDLAPRFDARADYAGWREPGDELAADCWAARQLAARRSEHVAAAAAVMLDSGPGAFTGAGAGPPPGERAARIRRCAGLR